MSDLVPTSSLREFFKSLLEEAIERQRLQVGEATEFYLVNLLSEFATAEKLFSQQTEGGKDHEPLAILYAQAQQQEREDRIRTLRRLGDVSLYKVGFFSGALQSGMVGP